MNTTGMVMTVTDELLAELEAIAQLATPGPWVARIEQDSPSFQGYYVSNYGVDMYACLGTRNQDEIDSSFIATANPATITALTAELRRLRAENAELAQSLAESRANDQAAMGWLTSLRWASGDRGERMLPELVSHIEGLAKDAGRYRWLRDSIWYVGPDDFYCGEGGDMNEYENHNCQADTLDAAIDTAMAAQ